MRGFTPGEDSEILRLVDAHGKKWTLIASRLNERTPAMVRNRYLRLEKGRSRADEGLSRNRCSVCGQIKQGHTCPGHRLETIGSHELPRANAGANAESLRHARPVDHAALQASPAQSILSVSVRAEKSPTFSFQPYSGYGNTHELPPEFSLDDQLPTAEANDSDDSTAHSVRSSHFFAGGSPSCVFHGWAIAVPTGVPKAAELSKIIERHGGHATSSVHARSTHMLVSTKRLIQLDTKAVKKARAAGLPIVTPAFLHDSLKAGEVLESHLPDPEVHATADSSWPGINPTERGPTGGDAESWAAEDDSFAWRRAIRGELQAAEGKALRRRKLRAAVLRAHLSHLEATTQTPNASSWWAANPREHKALFRWHLRRARKAGRLATDNKVVRWIPHGVSKL